MAVMVKVLVLWFHAELPMPPLVKVKKEELLIVLVRSSSRSCRTKVQDDVFELSAEARATRCDRYKPRSTSSLVAPLCVLTRRRIELSVPTRKTWWSGTGNRW